MTLSSIVIAVLSFVAIVADRVFVRRWWGGKVRELERKVARRDEQIHHLQGL